MNQLLRTKKEIITWLKAMKVKNYTLVPHPEYGFVVDVDGGVSLAEKNLKKIPINFNVVKGRFHCNDNDLTSLAGCPLTVGSNFNCDNNCLTTLMHCPQSVGGYFSCDENEIETLRHVPRIINGDFYCNQNSLKNLEYCPGSVRGNFNCTSNPLDSLEFCPSTVGGGFLCSDTNLGEISKITDFNEIYQIHKNYLTIKAEQQLLNDMIEPNMKSDKSYKI